MLAGGLRMYICTLYKSQVSESLYTRCTISTRRQSPITFEPPKSENKTLLANSTALLDVLRGLGTLDLCSE